MGSPNEIRQPGYSIEQHTPSDSVKEVAKEETAEVCKDREESQWQPGFFRRFPIIGFASLVLCIGCEFTSLPAMELRLTVDSGTGAAIGILRMTHHEKVTEFTGRQKPEVLLSYTTTIANSLMGFAYAEAAVIGFWKNALDAMPVSHPLGLRKTPSAMTYNDSRRATFTTTGRALPVLWGPSSPSSIGELSWSAQVRIPPSHFYP